MNLVNLMSTYESEAAFGRSNVANQFEIPSALLNDMVLPCDSCKFADTCSSKKTECSAFRKWSKNGQYESSNIARHIRSMK